MIGFYAVTEVFKNFKSINDVVKLDSKTIGKVSMPAETWKRSVMPWLRNSPLGFMVGVLPGAEGGTIATFLSCTPSKSASKHPEEFGKGAVEGLAGPESANNADLRRAGAAADPRHSRLGHDGGDARRDDDARRAPRSVLFEQQPEVAWGVIASMMVGNIALLLINLPLAIPLVQLLKIPQRIMLPLVLGLHGLHGCLLPELQFVRLRLVSVGTRRLHGFEAVDPDPAAGAGPDPRRHDGAVVPEFAADLNGSYGIFVKPIALTFLIMAVASLVYALLKHKKSA